jgi:hypothetical protein
LKLPSVSRQIRHWICSEGPASRSIEEGSERGIGGTRGEDSAWSAIEICLRRKERRVKCHIKGVALGFGKPWNWVHRGLDWIRIEKEKKNLSFVLSSSFFVPLAAITCENCEYFSSFLHYSQSVIYAFTPRFFFYYKNSETGEFPKLTMPNMKKINKKEIQESLK